VGSFLSNVGDDVNDFFIDSFREEEYDINRVQYELIEDSLVNGVTYDSVFVFTNDPLIQQYRVIFTFVGQGAGDYEVDEQLVNGRVFRWIAPVNNSPQGSYVAKLKLVPPQQQQMFTLTTSYDFNDRNTLELETALSNKDLNTFSQVGNNDNQGGAIRLRWNGQHRLGKDSLRNIFSTSLNKLQYFRA